MSYQEALTPAVLRQVEATLRDKWRRRQEEAVAIRAMRGESGKLLRQLGMGESMTFLVYLREQLEEARGQGFELQAAAINSIIKNKA